MYERSADHDAAARDGSRVFVPTREAEVEDLDVCSAAADEHQVGRLDVAVHDTARLREGEPLGNALRERPEVLGTERAPTESLLERFAFQPLHGEVALAVRGAPARHVADDAGVLHAREQRGLALEPLFRCGLGGPQQLQRDVALCTLVARNIHLAVGAFAHQSQQLETIYDARAHAAPRVPPTGGYRLLLVHG